MPNRNRFFMHLCQKEIQALICFLLILFFSPAAKAADVTVVLDDSSGMCGYWVDKNSEYHNVLARLQNTLVGNNVSFKVRMLSELSNVAKPKATIQQSSVGENNSNAGLNSLGNIRVGSQRCPFRASTSPLNNFHRVSGKKLTILISDMIFDLGQNSSGNSAGVGHNEFINGMGDWNANIQKNGKEAFFNSSTGLMGFQSQFQGRYFGQRQGTVVDFAASIKRPFYIFWKSSDNRFSGKLLKDILAASNSAESTQAAFSFTPSIGPVNTFEFKRPQSIKEMLGEAQRAFVIYELARTKQKGDDNSDFVPTNCFTPNISTVEIVFDSRCVGNDDDGSMIFMSAPRIKQALIVIPVKHTSNFQHTLSSPQQSASAGFSVGLKPFVFDEKKHIVHQRMVTEIKAIKGSALVIEIPRNPLFFRTFSHSGSGRTPGSSQANPNNSILIQDIFSSAGEEANKQSISVFVNKWSAKVEPCLPSPTCSIEPNRTIGLQDFIEAQAKRFASSDLVLDWLNGEANSNSLNISFKKR
jgi:hypothetical protein